MSTPRRPLPLSGALLLLTTVFTIVFATSACAQERPANTEVAIWFGGQFGDAHAFSETSNARLYQLESRYGRLVFARRPKGKAVNRAIFVLILC